jgi:hypothetical protein
MTAPRRLATGARFKTTIAIGGPGRSVAGGGRRIGMMSRAVLGTERCAPRLGNPHPSWRPSSGRYSRTRCRRAKIQVLARYSVGIAESVGFGNRLGC